MADGVLEMEQATFGGGCFWCVEAVMQRVPGVTQVVSGYSGGNTANPTYQQICSGRTGHAEVVQVTYDENLVSFAEVLRFFLKTHDPTTLNRQGHDVGTQYRSIVLAHNESQASEARRVIEEMDRAGAFGAPIVTQVVPLEKFYPAEVEHQDYYNRNPENRYCQIVVQSKVDKLTQLLTGS